MEVAFKKIVKIVEGKYDLPVCFSLRRMSGFVMTGTVRHRHNGGGRSGQSLIESVIVILLICLIFVGLLQVSQLVAARQVLHHAAARGARAKTVGFNDWMVEKAIRVAAIPNSGRLITPEFENVDQQLRDAVANSRPGELWDDVLGGTLRPRSQQFSLEIARIPEYLGSENSARSRYILDYDYWYSTNDVGYTIAEVYHTFENGQIVTSLQCRVAQTYPLWVPGHRAFYGAEDVRLGGESVIEKHYELYIDDRGW